MKIGIIGAGISGLSCARELIRMGHKAVIFEKSRGPGGRVATRRKEGFVWDTGATSIASRGMAIEKVFEEESSNEDLVNISLKIDIHSALRVSAGDPGRATSRFTYKSGINQFAKLLAKGVEIRYQQSVQDIERAGDHFKIRGEAFDAVIITAPIPQSSLLLWSLGEDRPLANSKYRTCMSVLLGYHAELPSTPYWALLDPEQRHPLVWLSLESTKSPGRAPEGCSALVAQLGPRFSFEHYDRPDEEIIATTIGFVRQLYGEAFATPSVSDIKRWKYSQPETIADFDKVNPAGSRIIVASDGLLGGHVETAFDVGIRSAKLIGAI